jgi:hypothetical protein
MTGEVQRAYERGNPCAGYLAHPLAVRDVRHTDRERHRMRSVGASSRRRGSLTH